MWEFKDEKKWLKAKLSSDKGQMDDHSLREIKRRKWIINAVNREYYDLMPVLEVYREHRRNNTEPKGYNHP